MKEKYLPVSQEYEEAKNYSEKLALLMKASCEVNKSKSYVTNPIAGVNNEKLIRQEYEFSYSTLQEILAEIKSDDTLSKSNQIKFLKQIQNIYANLRNFNRLNDKVIVSIDKTLLGLTNTPSSFNKVRMRNFDDVADQQHINKKCKF